MSVDKFGSSSGFNASRELLPLQNFVRKTAEGDIYMINKKITNLGEPTRNDDAATKAYSDLNLSRSGGTMDGELDMNTFKIVNLPAPTNDNDCATKK